MPSQDCWLDGLEEVLGSCSVPVGRGAKKSMEKPCATVQLVATSEVRFWHPPGYRETSPGHNSDLYEQLMCFTLQFNL